MKKSTNRQSRTRLQSIDAAQLAQVAGGVPNTPEFYRMINDWVEAMGDDPLVNEFLAGGIRGAWPI